jgi:hypothetical protein
LGAFTAQPGRNTLIALRGRIKQHGTISLT